MKKNINSLIIHLVMFSLALSWLYPYIWMVLSSFKQSADIYTTGCLVALTHSIITVFCLKTVAGWKNLF